MKKRIGIRDSIGILAAAGLFAVLVGLTAALIMTFLASSSEAETFDLEQATADKNTASVDLTGYFLPEFAGINSGGIQRGISASSGIAGELFRLGAPAAAELLTVECFRGEITEEEWLILAEEDSLYFRFHERTPMAVMSVFAGLYSGTEPGMAVQGYVSELLILPYFESEQYQKGMIRAAVRDSDGIIYLFAKVSPLSMLTAADLAQTAESYRSSMYSYVYAEETYVSASSSEPVFTSPVSFRNIIITGDTASLMREEETDILLRAFEMNPDKLLTTHVDEDGTRSYIDTQGVLYVRKSEIAYRSTADNGILISDLTTVSMDTIADTLQSYIASAVDLWQRICKIGKIYTGEEADLLLTSFISENGTVVLRFSYTVDNLRIMTGQPAFEAVFENGSLRSASVHTIAVMNLGTRSESLSETWFHGTLGSVVPENVTLVYRARYAPVDSADYTTDAVIAEWTAVTERIDPRRKDG